MNFNYEEFTNRNIGFLSEDEQKKLPMFTLFIPGLGGMGGALVNCLVRMGFEKFILADPDFFELSNFNRQVFANSETLNQNKATVAREEILKINPHLEIELLEKNWPAQLDRFLPTVDLIVNGCDDVKASVTLYRKAKEYKLAVVDAFPSVLPNVYVTHPHHPRPEDWLDFPTNRLDIDKISAEDCQKSSALEIKYVMENTPNNQYIHDEVLQGVLEGNRSKPAFAPMVWMSACLMAYEVVKHLLKKGTPASPKGVFWDPWALKTVKPK